MVLDTDMGQTVLVHAALTCVTCDIPAARKVCGFLGHNANLGCSKCLKKFHRDRFGDKADFSGHDRDNWVLREKELHRTHAQACLSAKTQTDLNDMEKEAGCRYTELLKLSYFDPVSMCIVDPMHNLLLGSSKHNC